MRALQPLRESPSVSWKKGDTLVVFGELFSRGYANGLIDEAKAHGLNVIYATVGRRDDSGLRPLNAEELAQKDQPLINVPLEAGFDMQPSHDGTTPVKQLEGLKLSEWQTAQFDQTKMKESQSTGVEDFRRRLKIYLNELEKELPAKGNILIAHTMAGGVPRAKVVMPAMNRVFKGYGDRYASSEEFWQSPMGRFCEQSFLEVTANTLHHLIDLTSDLRLRLQKSGREVAYVAYGYHGTEVLIDGEYRWQSYSPYLQGFAKLELENIAARHHREGVRVSVYNAPEILTNSSSIFVGVEVPLYPLLGALKREGSSSPAVKRVMDACFARLKPGCDLDTIMARTTRFFNDPITMKWTDYSAWPQHNGKEQMELMRAASQDLIEMHMDPKQLITEILSEVVFKACGKAMFASGFKPEHPVYWLGHDLVAKVTAK